MVSRREFLTIGTGGLAAASLSTRAWAQASAQTPKRGGTLSLRTWDPPHFDHILAHAYKTHVVISFTHSRLLKVKAGPSVKPGTYPIEADVAESWTQAGDTTWIFKLRRDVRWHNKPPVNGRELTADDVKYTYERFLTIKGNPNRGTLEQLIVTPIRSAPSARAARCRRSSLPSRRRSPASLWSPDRGRGNASRYNFTTETLRTPSDDCQDTR